MVIIDEIVIPTTYFSLYSSLSNERVKVHYISKHLLQFQDLNSLNCLENDILLLEVYFIQTNDCEKEVITVNSWC